VEREIKGTYRRSFLGPAWAVLQPLSYMLVFLLVRAVLQVDTGDVPYVLFTFSALVPWTFFSNAVARSGPSVIMNASLIKKMAIRREIFPLAAVATSLVDLVISSVILAGMMIWYGVEPSVAVFWLPVLVFLVGLFAFGVGLAVAAMGTYKRDIIFAVPFGLQLWMLATPIMYPLERVPAAWRSLYEWNPMVATVEGFRAILIHGVGPETNLLATALLGTVAVLAFSWPLYHYMSQYFADVL
jgi:lipopolysaccharide transport system permease protein